MLRINFFLSLLALCAVALATGCSSASHTDPGPAPGPAPAPSAPTAPANVDEAMTDPAPSPEDPSQVLDLSTPAATELATLGAGCFWCVEAVYEQLPGVKGAVSGYMGGHVDNPTYEQVCGKKTGHVEVVQVEFDPSVISYSEVLDWFWRLHDPTSWDRQGADAGPQYRSAVFFHSPEQEAAARASLAAAQPAFSKPIVTEVRAAATFWPAEAYHQGFYFDNTRHGYCRSVIAPKLEKLGLQK